MASPPQSVSQYMNCLTRFRQVDPCQKPCTRAAKGERALSYLLLIATGVMGSPHVTANGQVTARGLYPCETFRGGRRADPYEVTGELPQPRVPPNSANTCPSPTASRQSSSPASKCGFLFAATLEDNRSHRTAPHSTATKKYSHPMPTG